jgi:hypothetical protein
VRLQIVRAGVLGEADNDGLPFAALPVERGLSTHAPDDGGGGKHGGGRGQQRSASDHGAFSLSILMRRAVGYAGARLAIDGSLTALPVVPALIWIKRTCAPRALYLRRVT